MTTVGYGDKAPKSAGARLFAIFWIIIGITTFSLVTAMLSAEISKHNNLPKPNMEHARVGVIRDHPFESVIIAQQVRDVIDGSGNKGLPWGVYEYSLEKRKF